MPSASLVRWRGLRGRLESLIPISTARKPEGAHLRAFCLYAPLFRRTEPMSRISMSPNARSRATRLVMGLALSILTAASAARAQQGDTAILLGTVSDTTDAEVPGVTISVTHLDTGSTVEVITDSAGNTGRRHCGSAATRSAPSCPASSHSASGRGAEHRRRAQSGRAAAARRRVRDRSPWRPRCRS